MGKRSNFERRKNDAYPTPYEAVVPLIPFVKHLFPTHYYEPCCGDGHLIDHLNSFGLECDGSSDMERDARSTTYQIESLYFITNPPWSRELLHPIIDNLSRQHLTWLLFDADWMHTKQAIPYLKRCIKIVSVGRVKWIPDSPYTGKDNCCWYLFAEPNQYGYPTQFYGRTE